MYAVEHYYKSEERSTHEIFETLNEAELFSLDENRWSKNHFPLFIFKADFNSELIYREKNGVWNYEDFSDTILRYYSFQKTLNIVNE